MPSDRPFHRPPGHARTQLGEGSGAGILDPDRVAAVVPPADAVRFVIRFDFPWDPDGEPRYATRHPDPPHDWALTGVWELARALSFTDYDLAARVLDFDYGRRRRDGQAQGAFGRVVILAEEIHDLTQFAASAMTELRDRAAG